jgi:hypothetical protein
MGASSTRSSKHSVSSLNVSSYQHCNMGLWVKLTLTASLMTSFFEPIKSDNSKNNGFGRNSLRRTGFNQL